MKGVQQQETSHLGGPALPEPSGVGPAQRVANEQMRRWYACLAQQAAEFIGDLGGGSRQGDVVAPARSRAVVEH